MRRTLATVGTVLLLAIPLAGCSDDDPEGEAADTAPSAEASDSSTAEAPALKVLPAPAPELPTARPMDLAPSGATFDACTVVSPELVTEVFGAIPGQAMPQQSSLGDPESVDCYYFGGDTVIVTQATTRADQDLPESSYSYAGMPGAVTVPGADRGWAVIFPGQEGSDTLVSGMILVKEGKGLNLAISITGHPYDDETLMEFAERLLEAM
jgi:hypothetical protein